MSCKTMRQVGVLLSTLICFCCCQTVNRLTGDENGNPPGNKYFSDHTAKWLGSDSTGGDSCWLVDAASFDSISTLYHGIGGQEARVQLEKLNRVHIHINDSVALLLQKTRDSTAITGREYQVLIYLDVYSGNLSAVWGPVGDNHQNSFEVSHSQSGFDYLPETDHMIPLHRMLLAQAHGHPKPREENLDLLRHQSDSDRYTAFKLQGAVYPVIAADGREGVQGELCRVVPADIVKPRRVDIPVGKTQGEPAKDKVFNVGLDALLIYSKGAKAQTDCLPATVSRILYGSLTTPSSLPRSR
jgi:hypothetical protein